MQMTAVDFTKTVKGVVDVLDADCSVTSKTVVTGNKAEIEEVRQTLESTAARLFEIDLSTTAFTQCITRTVATGSKDSTFPGFTPLGAVDEPKRRQTASKQ